MSYVSIAILTPAEARELRDQAQAVLRTVRHRLRCQCETPWLGDDHYCGRCGRWVETPRLARFLRKRIEDMERDLWTGA